MKMLTIRQERFVENYILSGNASEAAHRAGYGKRGAGVTANRLLKNANVLAYASALRAANAEKFALSRDAVIAELQAAINIAREQRNPAAMISGWREVARICGFYEPVKHGARLTKQEARARTCFENMSDQDLITIAEAE